jgi:GH15 family glucan-1,4-alpha-glucosidase
MEGYRGSRPVRIGNGAAFHIQLDVYGELMDGIYLANRFGKPITYDQWLSVREIADYVCSVWKEKDMSIWEVRVGLGRCPPDEGVIRAHIPH